MDKINIQFTLFSAFYSPLIVTMAGGFLKDEGLEYEWSVAPVGKSAIEAIENGTADVIQSAPSQGFNSLKQNKTPPVVHFAQINEMDGFYLVGRNGEPQSTDAFDWQQLEGAEVVMFAAGQPNAMFRYACHKAGVDYTKIIPITPGGPDAIDQAFRAGQGQFAQQQGPYPQQLVKDAAGSIVAQCGPVIGPCAFSSLAASRNWLSSEAAVAFTRAYSRARKFLNSASASEIAAIEEPWFPETDLAALTECIASYQKLGCWTPHVEITETAFSAIVDIFTHAGTIDKRYTYNQVCDLPPVVS